MQVIDSHPDNVKIEKEIVDVQEVSKEEYPSYIRKDEVMPYQPGCIVTGKQIGRAHV